MESYQNLLQRTREIAWLNGSSALLSWDQETYMPTKALEFRADQLAYLSGLTHKMFTAPEVGNWLKACEAHGFDSENIEAANVREWRRSYDRATKLPTELVEEMQRASSLGREAWMEARKKSDFSIFKPHLETLVSLNCRAADCWGYEVSRYDALLESYEPGARAADLKTLFASIKPEIVQVLKVAQERSASIPKDLLKGHYSIEKQQALNRKIAEAFGFNFEAGRIDTTTHPFCSGVGSNDCRLTTRYNETDFTSSLYGVLHEAGHGLYEQGLDSSVYGLPMGEAVSLGIHESQSRFWENHVGRSRAFWEYWHPVVCEHFPNLKAFSPEQIYKAVNRVEPGFIRVDADEVTYDLHIILRFELEVKLIEGSLKVKDVPDAWNELFKAMMGLPVPNDGMGCLQDIHWSMGNLGYFPTYSLGNLNASQLEQAALKQNPALEKEMGRGDYRSMLAWLHKNVHQYGKRYLPPELMKRATGKATSPEDHLNYLKKKFTNI